MLLLLLLLLVVLRPLTPTGTSSASISVMFSKSVTDSYNGSETFDVPVYVVRVVMLVAPDWGTERDVGEAGKGGVAARAPDRPLGRLLHRRRLAVSGQRVSGARQAHTTVEPIRVGAPTAAVALPGRGHRLLAHEVHGVVWRQGIAAASQV